MVASISRSSWKWIFGLGIAEGGARRVQHRGYRQWRRRRICTKRPDSPSMRMTGTTFLLEYTLTSWLIIHNLPLFIHVSSSSVRNRDGYLTKAELRKTSRKMTDAQIDAVFEKFDKNKDGRLDFDEFKELMESHKRSTKKWYMRGSWTSAQSEPWSLEPWSLGRRRIVDKNSQCRKKLRSIY